MVAAGTETFFEKREYSLKLRELSDLTSMVTELADEVGELDHGTILSMQELNASLDHSIIRTERLMNMINAQKERLNGIAVAARRGSIVM